jgi:molybdenum cofactor cytidylyltransferase
MRPDDDTRRKDARVRVAAIVLAAGRATRMGEQKLLLPLAGRPIVGWVVDAALGSRASETFVVVGHEAERLGKALAGKRVTVVENALYEEGLSTSMQAGVRAVGERCDAVIFLLGDQPFVSSSLLDLLIDRFAETGRPVVRPVVDDQPGNPVLMSAGLFPEILEQRGDVGGREIIGQHPDEVCLVPVGDPRVVVDIDSIEDYEAAGEIA